MTVFDFGDIVRVPFPFAEQAIVRSRPALIISRGPLGPDGLLVWAAMITNAFRPDWPGDVAIANSVDLGLVIPSKVRTAKVNALPTGQCARIGRLDGDTVDLVRRCLKDAAGW